MSEIILMPTPNWFISRPTDISQKNGTIAFSVICSILFTDSTVETHHASIKDAHSKRILGLAYHQGIMEHANFREETLLASCGEDLEVKVWNTRTKTLIAQHKLHLVNNLTF